MPPSPSSPCLLVLDTATEVAHLALLARGQVLARKLEGGAQASITLLPALQALMAEAELPWSALDAIGFGQGPGAFTGLRTACAVTQGLALGLDRPVLALDTLMAVAEAARTAGLQAPLKDALAAGEVLWALQDARMAEVYAAAYSWDEPSGWQQVQPPVLWPLAHLDAEIAGGRVAWGAGSALAVHEPARLALGPRADAAAQPHGHALATLALQAWTAGAQRDAALALPLYVRDKVAQTTQERQADRQARALPADRAGDAPHRGAPSA